MSVVARAGGYSDSAAATTEVWTGLFRVVPSTHSVTVWWWSDIDALGETRFLYYTDLNRFRFSIYDAEDTYEVIAPVDISTRIDADTNFNYSYTSSANLSPGTDYVLRVALTDSNDNLRDFNLAAGGDLHTGEGARLYQVAFSESPFNRYSFRTSGTALPQLATSTVAATATTDSITATWDAVANASSYEVSLYAGGDTSGNQVGATQTIDAADEHTASFTNLTPGTQYTVAVVAIANPAMHRDSEAGTDTITTEAAPLPRLATPNVATTQTINTITVSWDAVPYAVRYFVFLYRGSGAIQANQITENVISGTEWTYSLATPNTPYSLSIFVEANPATHRNSERSIVDVTTLQAPQLATPQNVQVIATTNSMTVTWNEVANATAYEVSLYAGGDTSGNQVGASQPIDIADARTASFLSLAPGTEYTVAVVAKANVATHRDSEAGTATTSTTITADRIKLAIPTAEQITSSATTDSITVSWTNVSAEVSTYSITLIGAGVSVNESVAVQDATSIVFSNLPPATDVNVFVTAQGNPAQYIDSDNYEVFVTTRIRTPTFNVAVTTDTVTVSNIDIGQVLSY